MKRLVLVGILLVVVVGASIWFIISSKSEPTNETPKNAETTTVTGDLKVTKTDSSSGLKAPEGFPAGIPIEKAGITESYKARAGGETIYTLSYLSNKSKDDIWMSYSDYMNTNGWSIDRQVSSKSLGQIKGEKGGDTLVAIISVRNSMSYVQINLTER